MTIIVSRCFRLISRYCLSIGVSFGTADLEVAFFPLVGFGAGSSSSSSPSPSPSPSTVSSDSILFFLRSSAKLSGLPSFLTNCSCNFCFCFCAAMASSSLSFSSRTTGEDENINFEVRSEILGALGAFRLVVETWPSEGRYSFLDMSIALLRTRFDAPPTSSSPSSSMTRFRRVALARGRGRLSSSSELAATRSWFDSFAGTSSTGAATSGGRGLATRDGLRAKKLEICDCFFPWDELDCGGLLLGAIGLLAGWHNGLMLNGRKKLCSRPR